MAPTPALAALLESIRSMAVFLDGPPRVTRIFSFYGLLTPLGRGCLCTRVRPRTAEPLITFSAVINTHDNFGPPPAFRELRRVLGEDKINTLVFRSRVCERCAGLMLCHAGRSAPWERTVVLVEKAFPLSGFRREFVGDAVHFLLLWSLRGFGLIPLRCFETFGFVWHDLFLLFPISHVMQDMCPGK